jgi:H+/Cl- antiporter ClcA
VGLAAFALFMGWAFYQVSQSAHGLRSLGPIWPYAVGGALIVGALSGFFMWLAFYSANHGYDDPDRPE